MNPNSEAALQETIRKGLAVIVAGTGVSISASYDPVKKQSHPQASWAGLLENGLECLARQDAWLGLVEIAPGVKVLSMEACEEGGRFADLDGVTQGSELLTKGVASPFACLAKDVVADGNGLSGGFLVLDVATDNP